MTQFRKYFFIILIIVAHSLTIGLLIIENIRFELIITASTFLISINILFYLVKKHNAKQLIIEKKLDKNHLSILDIQKKIECILDEITKSNLENSDLGKSTIKEIKYQSNYLYNRIEAFHRIDSKLNNKKDFGSFSNWALYSDSAIEILDTCKGKELVFEIGSGISSVIISQNFKNNRSGKLISIEHDKEFYHVTRKRLEELGLLEYCEIHHCPLIEIDINGMTYTWYDISQIQLQENSIDVLLVDGPPGISQKNARFPAYPLLKKYLHDNATILLDDGRRKDETEIASLWEDSGLQKHFINTSKGLFKLS